MPEPKLLHENLAEFAAAVAKSRGKLIVLVHPLYAEHRNLEVLPKDYLQKLDNLIKKRKGTPLLVLEEVHNVARSHERLKDPNIFYLETRPNGPEPFRHTWTELHDVLKKAGIKTILIGGSYASAHDRYGYDASIVTRYEAQRKRRPLNIISRGCVGHAYASFIQGGYGKVRLLPELVYPDKPRWERQKA
ncbi:MAG: hypothetical protein V1644_01135 [Candidatus Micrarchaeota archaeon]